MRERERQRQTDRQTDKDRELMSWFRGRHSTSGSEGSGFEH